MRNIKTVIAILATALITFTSCDKNNGDDPNGGSQEEKIIKLDATSNTTWHYYSFATQEFVGTSELDNQNAWEGRTDWDIAIRRYMIKTNSGASGSGKSGLYVAASDVKYTDLLEIPTGSEVVADYSYLDEQMDGSFVATTRSQAIVSVMKGMPPTWLKSPIYVFPIADGSKAHKVEFLGYKDAEGTSGHVSFRHSEIAYVAGDFTNKMMELKDYKNGVWNYYSLSKRAFVGTSNDKAPADEASWEESRSWDFAINANRIRTNSGTSGSGKAGIFQTEKGTKFSEITTTPAGIQFVADKMNMVVSMGGSVQESNSNCEIAKMDMSSMPPKFNLSPVQIITDFEGLKNFKVEFLSYTLKSGVNNTSFKFERIEK